MAMVLPVIDPEVITRTLYKTDESAKERILPAYVEQLAEADRAFYREQGYLAMEGLFTARGVESYKVALADVINGRVVKVLKLYIQEKPYFKDAGADERAEDDLELRVR